MGLDQSRFLRLRFKTEAHAKAYLRERLKPYFAIQWEIECQHLLAGNTLYIDYVARPLPGIDFPFPWFGGEIKRGGEGIGDYNRSVKQCIDYTQCKIIDPRVPTIYDKRIERVYLFPGMPENGVDPYYGVNRLAGLFHVGMIYFHRDFHSRQVEPHLLTSADRQWSPTAGAIARKHNVRQRVGSGVLRVVK